MAMCHGHVDVWCGHADGWCGPVDTGDITAMWTRIMDTWTHVTDVQMGCGPADTGDIMAVCHGRVDVWCGPVDTSDITAGWLRVMAGWRITTIRLGKHSLYTREWGEAQKMVQKLVAHPDYDPTTKDNDIMLIKLLTPVTLTSRIQPIPVASCLPEPGTTCTTSGWGATSSPEVSYPDVLQCVNVTLFSTAECDRLYPGSLTENMLCAGSLQGGRDSCQGDSGGPLVCNRTLQGIVSWGMEKCGQPKRPGVYTKVCRYAQWIQKTMKEN
ncbi:trypsin-like [Egretta garzetta]|uniref:trypsin-like n=1 Tax=Egretta garzetta TaxID=188379 RepID=UPI00051F0DFA|nr:trypsin-like [Egretta garzetta]